MTSQQETHDERRKNPRFAIEDCMFDADMKFGRVIEVSITGMSFYYADRKPWTDLDQICGTLHFLTMGPIKNIQMQTISDFELPNRCAPDSMVVRRRSVSFSQLTDTQKIKLEELITQISQDHPNPTAVKLTQP
ncbi:MAG: hypothetical protein OEL55_04865 [Desulfobulbaceae bacterium]|nr:hypothetical protein [Desulfobulbaceae bacterium]